MTQIPFKAPQSLYGIVIPQRWLGPLRHGHTCKYLRKPTLYLDVHRKQHSVKIPRYLQAREHTAMVFLITDIVNAGMIVDNFCFYIKFGS